MTKKSLLRQNSDSFPSNLQQQMDTTAYQRTIDFLYNQLPMYQRQGSKAIKKDLTNIRTLLAAMGNPQEDYPIIHIAGTNGKGTVAHLTTAILTSAGYKTGLYTSPHYVDFRERIKIDGEWITQDAVVQFARDHQELIASVRPSFFEITVAMALSYFRQAKVDIAVIETGLGGRLDSTNVVSPILTAITNISLDHVQMLGPDIYTIAGEKAGIIKSQVPVIIGRHQVACDQVFWKVAQLSNAPISFASVLWSSSNIGDDFIFKRRRDTSSLRISLRNNGPFLVENIVTVLELFYQGKMQQLLQINEAAIKEGIEHFKRISGYIGRWQIISKQPHIIADSAHNLQAIQAVLTHLNRENYSRIHFVLGFVKEKELKPILALFDQRHSYYFTRPAIERGLSPDELATIALEYGLIGNTYSNVQAAYHAAMAEYKQGDLIYVGGSSFVVGDFLAITKEEADPH